MNVSFDKINKYIEFLTNLIPENIYGKSIIVVRTISNKGATRYSLKTSSGRVVSNARKDLLKLTLCLNIQVDNPVLILNQDAARSFLKECDPHKLYNCS